MINHYDILTAVEGRWLAVAGVPIEAVPGAHARAEDIARLLSKHDGGNYVIMHQGQRVAGFTAGQRDTGAPCVRYGCGAAERSPVHAPDGNFNGGHPYASADRQPGAKYAGGDRDWPECRCGNEPSEAGFAPCLPDGTITTPLAAGPWDGIHIVCLQCGRIIDQDTLRVTGHHANPEAMAAEAEAADAEEMAAGNG
jgi:hypothetical protein